MIARRVISLFIATFLQAFKFPWRGKEITKSIVNIGIESLPIVTISTAFAGIVITNEIIMHMKLALSTATMAPGFSGQFILRELGIAIPALLVVSRVGASMAAEMATMKVTERVEALRLLRIDPVAYLIFPRCIASIFSMACLTLVSIVVTLVCAMSVAVWSHGFNFFEYLTVFRTFVKTEDLFCSIAKSLIFGAVIPVISCAYGLESEPGAEGVGSATTKAVVASTMAIIVLDFVLTYFFSLLLF